MYSRFQLRSPIGNMVSQTICLLLLLAVLSTSPLLTSANTTPATGAGCISTAIWTQSNNTGVFGGVAQTNVSTIAACQASCIASPNSCIAIDFDSTAGCFFIPPNNPNNKVARSGITHFDLTRPTCPTTTPAGTLGGSGFYSIWYLKTGGVVSVDPNTLILNVVEDINRATRLTVSPCLANNNSNFGGGPNCISLSPASNAGSYVRLLPNGSLTIDAPTNQLYPQRFNEDTSFNFFSNVFFSTGGFTSFQSAVNSYRAYLTGIVTPLPSSLVIQQTPATPTLAYNNSASFFTASTALPTAPITDTCPNVWTRISGARLPLTNLLSIGVTNSQAICRQKCLVYPGCIGVSYLLTTGSCSLALSSAQSGAALVTDPTYVHYDLSPTFPSTCTRGCAYTWTLTTASVNSSTYNTFTSPANFLNCRIACVSNLNCVGVTWSIVNSTATCTTIISSSGILSGSTTLTYYAVTRPFVSCGPCSLTVYITPNATDINGVFTLGTSFRGPCRTACVNNPLCTGFDIVGGSCTLSFTSSPLLTISPTGGYHTDIIRSSCGNGCIDKWDLIVSTNGTNTTAYAATTELACRLGCLTSSTCLAFDWNNSLQVCMFSSIADSTNMPGSAPGWNHYEWNGLTFGSPNIFNILSFCDGDSP